MKPECVTNTVAFLSHNVPVPTVNQETKIQQELQEISKVLQSPLKSLPFLSNYN